MVLLTENLINFKLILSISVILNIVICSEILRPRGVSLSRASLYNPDKNFQCFDNNKIIPYNQVNDDYCDCADGSDEPGTSACPNGIFHCTNAGHKPLNLPSHRVNDGICDCCDGSDEYHSKIQCVDRCLELGRHAREQAQRLAEVIKAGKQLRDELSQQGSQLKQAKTEKLNELKRNREEAEKIKAEKQQLKDEIETIENQALEHYRKLEEEEKRKLAEVEAAKNREEAIETFNKFDSNRDGVVDLAELKTRQTFDKDRNGEVSDEEARFFLNNEDAVDIEKFIDNCWQNIKPYLMMDSGLFKPPQQTEETEDSQTNHEEVENEQETDDDEEDDDDEEEDEPPTPEEVITADDPSPSPPPPPSKYDDETQKIVDQATSARNEFTEAENAVRNIENEIKSIQEYLEKDFGQDDEFATLEGQCFDYTDHEYIYKLCPFDQAVQQPKSGTLETRLGQWGRWASPNDNKYGLMIYDRGQSCWNGPQRSAHVRITCGVENKVISVTEPNRCEYLFEFTTPAACRELTNDTNNDDTHDEL